MDNIRQGSYADSLMAEVNAWSRFEKIFKESVGETEMKERDFLKMKLKEFDRIWFSHPAMGKAGTVDERAMQIIVRYQRKKLEKALYPKLLRRWLHQARVFVTTSLDGTRSLARARKAMQNFNYTIQPLTVRQTATTGQEQGPTMEQSAERKPHYGADLGSRNSNPWQSKNQHL